MDEKISLSMRAAEEAGWRTPQRRLLQKAFPLKKSSSGLKRPAFQA